MLLMMAEVVQLSRVAQALPGNGSGISWRTTRRTSSGRAVRCTTPSSPGFHFWSASRCRIRSQPHRQGRDVPRKCSCTRCGARCCWWRWASFCAPCIARRPTSRSKIRCRRSGSATRFLFLLAFRPPRWQWTALGVLLFGYWLAWASLSGAAGLDTSPASWRIGIRTEQFGQRVRRLVPEFVPDAKPFVQTAADI